MSVDRDFNTISPSASGILFMKALTTIPYAREAAIFIAGSSDFEQYLLQRASRTFFGRVIHFENRYRTVDVLLHRVEAGNILEIASGFSFRGLELCMRSDVVYIDTDLPDAITPKMGLVAQLADKAALKGKLLMEPLNALDESAFMRIIDLFPPGPVTIINEGLLVYLDTEEKRKLCAIIHKALSQRGGQWITGDIYTRKGSPAIVPDDPHSEAVAKFLAEHKVEENKFEDYEEATALFHACGFAIVEKADAAFEQLSILNRFGAAHIQPHAVQHWFKARQTWMLRPA